MKRERGSEELWSSIVEKLYGTSRERRDYYSGTVQVDAAELELVCRIARRGLKGYRP